MKRLVLHIGRHKTGTKAIQRFLYKNRDWLIGQGLYYPVYGTRGFGHNEIGASLARRKLADSDASAESILTEVRSGLDSEIGAVNSTIVISSEAFQNCDPLVVKRLLKGLDVEVVVYIREQVEYLLSAYAQKVQATGYMGSLHDFYETTSRATYLDFLSAWDSAFSDRVRVRVYDKQELRDGDVVADFACGHLGLKEDEVKRRSEPSDPNPSLTRDLVDFKLRLNRRENLLHDQSLVLFSALSALSREDTSGPLPISSALAHEIAERYLESNTIVARRYLDRTELFAPFVTRGNQVSDEDLQQQLARVREQLVLHSPELDALLPTAQELIAQ